MRPANSFPRERRLQKRKEFLACYAGRQKFHTPHFILHACEGSGPCKFGLTVSRKVGNAVVRARVKRLLRECLRTSPFAPENCRIVIVARHQASTVSLSEIGAELYPVLRRLSIQ